MGDRRWGGPDTGGGAAEYVLWTERRKKDERREEMGKMFCRARRPDESRRGEKSKEPKSYLKGNIESLKIGTESRGNHSLCSGLE